MASEDANQELEDLIRRLREMDSFLKSFLTSFQDDLERGQVQIVKSMVREIESTVESLKKMNNRHFDETPETENLVLSVENDIEHVTEIIEQVLEAEVNSIEEEFEDIASQ